ncbi:MAG TPA: MFS transporter [Candidatus Ozemobacteraceae bacterium]|nr:MFS transporter [Candidatus Ozemobacteraceae bacterium]
MTAETWKFPKEFWLANFMELCERAAYYGFFIVLTLFLTDIVGFSDKETGVVAGVFYAFLYLLPPFVGAFCDKIGFRYGMIVAFSLLTVGYTLLGFFHGKLAVILILGILMVGGSFIKPLITGTVAKTTNEINRARAYSLFYWVVNLGAFGGKTVVPYVRQGMGLEYVNFFSAGMSFLALLFAIFMFKNVENETKSDKTIGQVFKSLKAIFLSPKLMILTLIVAGFWIIQQQMYATMPKYVIRLLGDSAKPEWLANVNPLVVVLFVVPITQLMKRYAAVSSMLVGMMLMPFSALAMAGSQWLETGFMGFHPLTIMMILGIAIQGVAECFISPRFLEYFSFQAPKGEEGVYLGFSHLHSFFSALAGFILSGFLLEAYCPDPKTLPAGISAAEKTAYYAGAHKIWFIFMGIGFVSAIALLIFRSVTKSGAGEQSISRQA